MPHSWSSFLIKNKAVARAIHAALYSAAHRIIMRFYEHLFLPSFTVNNKLKFFLKTTIMKKTLLPILLLLVSICKLQAQANTTLSNLTSPTAINQSLLAGATNTFDLGSSTQNWRALYVNGSIYTGTNRGIFWNSSNAAFGHLALLVNTGLYNTATGNYALNKNSTGYYNTASGYTAMYNNTTGGSNTVHGYAALFSNTTGYSNTANGYLAMYSNTTGFANTAIGYSALFNNTTGQFNTATGYSALRSNTTGRSNAAYGLNALYKNTKGYSNVAIGAGALYNNVKQNNLVAIGDSALFNNGIGTFYSIEAINTAIGSKCLYSNTTGDGNTATGHRSLYSNTIGSGNTAIGHYSLYSNIDGSSNTANGSSALLSNITGSDNTANGSAALLRNTSGDNNTAIGRDALYVNTTGSFNTANGSYALSDNIGGTGNTASGYDAGNDGGSFSDDNNYCSFLGYDADKSSSAGFINSTAIGNTSRITASNQVRIGNGSVTSIGGYANWSNVSDGRIKKDVKENVPGLAFINKLKAITYHLNVSEIRTFLGEGKTDEETKNHVAAQAAEEKALIEEGVKEKEKIIYTGFVAQEVEKAAKELDYDFSGVDKPQNENSLYGLRYAEFVVPLVKAVQELSKQNDEKDMKINELETRLAKLENLLSASAGSTENISLSNALLEQNIPNPFTNTTIINYTLPQKFTAAQIIITDQNGKTLKLVNVSGAGRGSLKIDAAILAAGAYHYSLLVDGKMIESKQMQHIR